MPPYRCTVEFKRTRFGLDAILMWRGHSINYLGPLRSSAPAAKRRARRVLMRGCQELARARERSARWSY